jgi:hypothetical protein
LLAYVRSLTPRKDVGFAVDFGDGKERTFADLTESEIVRLRDYLIPTVEIELNENTTLNEMINLFVDINQYGKRVSRLNIVRALKGNDPLLKDVYELIAERQVRKQDVFTNRKRTHFVAVLKRLKIISSISDPTAQAERMWEKMLELALFVRSEGVHRKPSEILNSFIAESDRPAKLTGSERTVLTSAFGFLRRAYRYSSLKDSRLATDQTHFYTMVTTLLGSDLIERFKEDELINKLAKFGVLAESPKSAPKGSQLRKILKDYLDISAKQTTDQSRRQERQDRFIQAIELL